MLVNHFSHFGIPYVFHLKISISSPVITSLLQGMGWVLEGWRVVGEKGLDLKGKGSGKKMK